MQMLVSDFLTGRRRFLPEPEIIALIKTSRRYDNDLQLGKPGALLIFETSKQHTWLVMTAKRLYVILDDVRRPQAKVQWSTSRIPPKVRTSKRSDLTGIVHFNERERGWLFTKRLFANIPIEKQIELVAGDVRHGEN